MDEQPGKLAVLFVDVIDDPLVAPGDESATAQLPGFVSMFAHVVAACGGRVVSAAGNTAMHSFPNAESAVVAACEMQSRMQRAQVARVTQASLRIGLHYGAAFLAGAVAQRMALCAASGQIIATAETNEILAAKNPGVTSERVLPARNNHDPVTVYEVAWQSGANHGRVPPRLNTIIEHAGVTRLRLAHGGRETNVITSVTIGRRSTHGIELKDPKASRDHAYIQRREDKFVLVDQSSHGTYVNLTGGESYKLRHSEMVLRGSGTISFGHDAAEEPNELVKFVCELHDTVATPVTVPPRTLGRVR